MSGDSDEEDAIVIALANAMFGLEGATEDEARAYVEDAEDALAKLRASGFDIVPVAPSGDS